MAGRSHFAATEIAKEDVQHVEIPREETHDLERAAFAQENDNRAVVVGYRKREMDRHRAAAEAAHAHNRYEQAEKTQFEEKQPAREEGMKAQEVKRAPRNDGYLDFDAAISRAENRAKEYNGTLPPIEKTDNGRDYDDGTPTDHLVRGGNW